MLSLLLALALAQPTPVAPPAIPQEPPRVNRIVKIAHADPVEVSEALKIFATRWMTMDVNAKLRVITLSGPEKDVADIEAMIKSLDVETPPAAQIEFRVRLLGASDKADDDKRDKLDEELKAVVSKLGRHFKLNAVWEIDSVLGRCEAGKNLQLSAGTYRVSMSTAAEVGDRIQFRQFEISGETSISTSLSVKPGETTVVGLTKTKSGQSVIAVITATVEK